jgi:enamine deaminase RidA (YjgF/YER057c/UK114 family)
MTAHTVLHPEDWPRPKGYVSGMAASGRMLVTAGLIGWTGHGVFEAEDFAGQFRQILMNTLAILGEGGAGPEHIVRMTWYIVDKDEYLACTREIGAIFREIMGRNYPAMAVVQVAGLLEPAARLEIETMAVVPE